MKNLFFFFFEKLLSQRIKEMCRAPDDSEKKQKRKQKIKTKQTSIGVSKNSNALNSNKVRYV
jgi:hypothetical protein